MRNKKLYHFVPKDQEAHGDLIIMCNPDEPVESTQPYKDSEGAETLTLSSVWSMSLVTGDDFLPESLSEGNI